MQKPKIENIMKFINSGDIKFLTQLIPTEILFLLILTLAV